MVVRFGGRPALLAGPGGGRSARRRPRPKRRGAAHLGIVVAAAALMSAACGTSTVSPAAVPPTLPPAAAASATPAEESATGAPASSGVPMASRGGTGSGWEAAAVEQPAALVDPWAFATPPVFCSPCHAPVATAIQGLAAGPTILVAVGRSFPPAAAAAWYSSDGRVWRAADVPPATEPALMRFAAIGPGHIVAVGQSGRDAAAWTSVDGRTWIHGQVEPVNGVAQERMLAVVAWRGGFASVGDVSAVDTSRGVITTAGRTWLSTDGTAWIAVAGDAQFEGVSLQGLAADAARLVAVGRVALPDGTVRGASWTTIDGRTWTPSPVDPALAGIEFRAVTTGGTGFVAVGTSDGGVRAGAWLSVDGLHWNRALDDGLGTSAQRIIASSVASSSFGFVAVGERDTAANGSATVWRSPDAHSWSRSEDVVSFDGAEMSAVAARGSLVIAAGALGLPDNWQAAAWSRSGP
jgi:hypothetical protein